MFVHNNIAMNGNGGRQCCFHSINLCYYFILSGWLAAQLNFITIQVVTRMRITKPNQNEIQRNRSRSKQEGGCSYPAYYLRVWNSPLKVLKECKDPAINVVDKSPKPVNNEFETPAVADSAMESRSQPSPVIAKSKRQSADQSVRYKSLTIGIFFDIDTFEGLPRTRLPRSRQPRRG